MTAHSLELLNVKPDVYRCDVLSRADSQSRGKQQLLLLDCYIYIQYKSNRETQCHPDDNFLSAEENCFNEAKNVTQRICSIFTKKTNVFCYVAHSQHLVKKERLQLNVDVKTGIAKL